MVAYVINETLDLEVPWRAFPLQVQSASAPLACFDSEWARVNRALEA